MTTIHHVFANRTNAGDWLSARGIQTALGFPPVKEHLCDVPFIESTLQELDRAGPDDLIIIGGGGLLMDYFVPFWQGFLPVAQRVPFVVWGVGFCDRKRHSALPPFELIETILQLSQLCILRDELTYAPFQHLSNVRRLGCPSLLAVQGKELPQHPSLLHVDHYDNVGPEIFEIMDKIGREFAEKTERRYRQTNNRLATGIESELVAHLGLYEAADLILSSRLHGCIMGLAMGRRVLAVSGDRKVESFMNALDLGDWVLDLRETDKIAGKLDRLHEQPRSTEALDLLRAGQRAIAKEIHRRWLV